MNFFPNSSLSNQNQVYFILRIPYQIEENSNDYINLETTNQDFLRTQFEKNGEKHARKGA